MSPSTPTPTAYIRCGPPPKALPQSTCTHPTPNPPSPKTNQGWVATNLRPLREKPPFPSPNLRAPCRQTPHFPTAHPLPFIPSSPHHVHPSFSPPSRPHRTAVGTRSRSLRKPPQKPSPSLKKPRFSHPPFFYSQKILQIPSSHPQLPITPPLPPPRANRPSLAYTHSMRIVFLGSGAFGLPSLDALAASGHTLLHILS